MKINEYIDHTLLKPTATQDEYLKLVEEAIEYNFKAICVPPIQSSLCISELKGNKTLLVSVCGFPLGYNSTQSKIFEIEELVKQNVDEIDFVINQSWVKSSQFKLIKSEFDSLRKASKAAVLKVIIEAGALNETEIKKVCDLAMEAELDFIKTSTGFFEIGAQVKDIQLIKKHVGNKIKIKASGGIRKFEFAEQLIEAGADRIGCSASVQIYKDSLTQGARS